MATSKKKGFPGPMTRGQMGAYKGIQKAENFPGGLDIRAGNETRSAPAGTYNERLLSYINTKLSTSHTNLNDAMQALAANQSADNFSSMGTFTP